MASEQVPPRDGEEAAREGGELIELSAFQVLRGQVQACVEWTYADFSMQSFIEFAWRFRPDDEYYQRHKVVEALGVAMDRAGLSKASGLVHLFEHFTCPSTGELTELEACFFGHAHGLQLLLYLFSVCRGADGRGLVRREGSRYFWNPRPASFQDLSGPQFAAETFASFASDS